MPPKAKQQDTMTEAPPDASRARQDGVDIGPTPAAESSALPALLAGEASVATPSPASSPPTPLTLAQIDSQIADSLAATRRLRMLRTATQAFEKRRTEIEALTTGAKS